MLRDHPLWIVATTANARTGDLKVCLNADLDGYLAKPVERIGLERLLVRLLSGESTAN